MVIRQIHDWIVHFLAHFLSSAVLKVRSTNLGHMAPVISVPSCMPPGEMFLSLRAPSALVRYSECDQHYLNVVNSQRSSNR